MFLFAYLKDTVGWSRNCNTILVLYVMQCQFYELLNQGQGQIFFGVHVFFFLSYDMLVELSSFQLLY